jgi:hypothetical protein
MRNGEHEAEIEAKKIAEEQDKKRTESQVRANRFADEEKLRLVLKAEVDEARAAAAVSQEKLKLAQELDGAEWAKGLASMKLSEWKRSLRVSRKKTRLHTAILPTTTVASHIL